MELSPEQKKALEEQKAQCPFCKIVKGEIASKKIYEDNLLLGILDINPAAKGHVLLMPKEHYPIMPFLPHETFTALFEKAHAIADAIQKGILATGINIFIANGAAAGQQSQHFMIHLIPRESRDILENFLVPSKSIPQEEIKKPKEMLVNNIGIMMGNHFKRHPAKWHDISKDRMGTIPQTFNIEQVLAIIEKNPQLKAAIEQDPHAFGELIKENEQLRMVFKDVSYDDVLAKLGISQKKKNNSEKKEITKNRTSEKENSKKQKKNKDDDVDLDDIAGLL